jgi:hypothetical protein
VIPRPESIPALPAIKAPIHVLDSVPATYPPAVVEAIQAPDEWRRGTAMRGSIFRVLFTNFRFLLYTT